MDIRPQTYVWVVCFFFCWKFEHGTGNKMNTWQQSVLDCYRVNSALESNISVLKNYMNNHTEVNSIWVGSFEALLPWVEIRGCYNISLIRNSLNRDEHVAENSSFCQMKCMNRQYFAFSQNDETCVCFDEHDIVKTESDNASLCHECTNKGDCSSYAVVYKVFNKSISVEGYDIDCMSYSCSSQDAVPSFHETRCSQYCVSLCLPQDFNNIEQYISHCYYLSMNDTLIRTDNCSVKQDYKCTSDFPDKSTTLMTTTLSNDAYLTDNSTIKSTTILNNALDLMVGIVVSIVVILLILIVLLVVLLRRKYQKDKLSLKTAGREDRDTNEMDNYIIISDYQQLDKVKNRKTKTKPYDQLHVKHPVDSYQTDDHSNTLSSREEHTKYESIENKNKIFNNKVTLEYEVLNKTQQDKMTKAYDQLHYPHVVDTDSTNNHSTTIIESEQKHKTSTNTTSLEYEELNNAEKDKSVNVYGQLNTTNEGSFNANMSKTMISTEEHINNESIEAATAMDKHTVTLEYEQLDIAEKKEGINVYDQLHVTP
ncbi:uncharacterized protein [Mytilus edulis]|uniref:uncharacterized protein n=1 Tax=Mytilus edulis TaxID=6550 RepID=UPI0039EE183F